jgi:outer membrane protein assembly factor BamB
MVLSITGYRGGAWLYRLTNKGKDAELVWHNTEVDNQMGGVVKVGDYIYSSGHHNSGLYCIDWTTGKTMWKSSKDELGESTIIYADGMLYAYSNKGVVALVKPNPEKIDIVSSFNVTMGTHQHWAHLVILDGVMYVRHGDALMAYKIKL